EEIGRGGKSPLFDAFHELWPDAGCLVHAENIAVGVDALALEPEDLLHRDDLGFHSGDLLNADDAAPAVAHSLNLNDDAERRGDLAAQRFHRYFEPGHADHVLEPR